MRLGHLKGNKFLIRIRGVSADAAELAKPILERIEELGLPNYFGPQRFGNRGDSHWIGHAFLVKDSRSAVRRILGHPCMTEYNPDVVAARYLFMQFRWKEALERFPGSFREERKLQEEDSLLRQSLLSCSAPAGAGTPAGMPAQRPLQQQQLEADGDRSTSAPLQDLA